MDQVEIEQIGHVRRIWLNNARHSNAQTKQMLVELDEAISAAGADSECRVIVIGGRGKHFSAGHDMKEAQRDRSDFTTEERFTYETQYYLDYGLNIWNCPKPTIIQVQGACIAGGYMLANMGDLLVAADDAWFWDPVTYSMGLASMEILFHPWVMGARHAKEFLLLGEKISAQDAYRVGMVNRVFPRAELDEHVLAMAQRIAEAPPFAMQTLKKSLNHTFDIQGFCDAVKAHFYQHSLTHASSEFAKVRDEGMSNVIKRNVGDPGKSAKV